MRKVLLTLTIPWLAATTAGAASFEHVGWLAGCWQLRDGERVTLEMWMAPAGDLMLGGSRTTVGDVVREYEHLRIHTDGERLIYTALPSGQRETAFPAVDVSESVLVFENLDHDFPQRIGYRREGDDALVARIEGPSNDGSVRGIDIPMRRVPCPGG